MADTSKPDKPKKSIGKFCPNCDTVRHESEFLNQIKTSILETKEKEQQYEIKPKKSPTFTKKQICGNCGSKTKTKTRKVKEKLDIYFDEGQNEWRVARNNPHLIIKCSKCNTISKGYLPMPNNPHYEISTTVKIGNKRIPIEKKHLKLAIQIVGSHRINLNTKHKLKKLGMSVHNDLKKERETKKLKELKLKH